MKIVIKRIFLLMLVLSSHIILGQNLGGSSLFTIRGFIYDSELQKHVSNANIEVNGGAYTTSKTAGEFRIQVKNGDELVIKHKDFETVYYTIRNQERIRVEVRPYRESSRTKVRDEPDIAFNSLIDSAVLYKKPILKRALNL